MFGNLNFPLAVVTTHSLINKKSISSTFYEQLLRQYFCTKKLKSQIVTREKQQKTLLYKKLIVKF